LRVPANDIVRLEDRYADRLVQTAIAAGFPAIIAHRARAWIDLNRAENDLDAGMLVADEAMSHAMPSAKTRGGLGLIPRRLHATGELWRRPFSTAEIAERIARDHRPFHAAIGQTLQSMRDRFGIAVLLDVHSMPPILPQPNGFGSLGGPAKIVVGDRYGRSAASLYAETILSYVRGADLAGALNHPYSGDHILERHGNPHRSIHALQLEIDRSLYLDSGLREPAAGLAAMAQLVLDIATLLGQQARREDFAQAAE
jgi:N-formylglutamate amidohydrolase